MAMAMAAATTLLFLAFLFPCLQLTEAQIGVCYGKYAADNLPPAQDVVKLYEFHGIGAMRIYDLDEDILRAVRDSRSGIKLVIQVPNANIQSVGSKRTAATGFVQQYVAPYASSIKYIVVGNEIDLNSPQAPLVGPAMQNVLDALHAANLGDQIKVTTAIGTSLVINPYPSSNGIFSDPAIGFMRPIASFLVRNGSPLFLNVYPYYAYTDPKNTGKITLDYALFRSSTPVFTDPKNQLPYYNLFDALVDATYWALSKVTTEATLSNSGGAHPAIAASETGWSSGFPPKAYHANADGGATLENAATYYQNLISHVKNGTPLRPGPMEAYLFEMFDEDNAPDDRKNFGLFYPNQQLKYNDITFN